ncbi:hypothetical protein TDB9533_00518 [Thalassocella blandensis]|nr:hypothetical protein TDB9533_00518 [Thalassocella blandensis]
MDDLSLVAPKTRPHAHPVDYTGAIIKQLWQPDVAGRTPAVFAVLDGARDKRIEPMVHNSDLEHDCLFAGRLSYALRRAAPHIVKLEPHSPFTHKVLSMGWGNAWGIFAVGSRDCELTHIRNRLRRIARVQGPNGKPLLFRYYDPRIMRAYLPTCLHSEVDRIYGSLSTIMMEGDDPQTMLRFTQESHVPLTTTTIQLSRDKIN